MRWKLEVLSYPEAVDRRGQIVERFSDAFRILPASADEHNDGSSQRFGRAPDV